MSQSFVISAVIFTIIMVIFHIIKDIILPKGVSGELNRKINVRWLVSTVIGYIILFLLYGRDRGY
jgi:hypothetical protein